MGGGIAITREKKDMTFGELFKLFIKRAPSFDGRVSDYRPAEGAYSIRVWTTDGAYHIARWVPVLDEFILHTLKEATIPTDDEVARKVAIATLERRLLEVTRAWSDSVKQDYEDTLKMAISIINPDGGVI